MDFFFLILPLILAWGLDLLLGDPTWLAHPVVWFGKIISFFEKKFNKGSDRKIKGGIISIFLVVAVFALVWWIIDLTSDLLWLNIAVRTILIFYCLAGTTLIKEVREVFKAVGTSLELGRKQVARIVGRDTHNLDSHEIKTAALETLAENLSDGVVAPLFWFAILGVPGMMAYKMINTLDSMIGYKNERYREFGMVAAKIDDAANFFPSRITAFLMIVCSAKISRFRFVRKYGRCHASPNSGYPEAALAGILDCRFGGSHDYFGETVYKPYIGEKHRDFSLDDAAIAVRVNRRVEFCTVILAALFRSLFLL